MIYIHILKHWSAKSCKCSLHTRILNKITFECTLPVVCAVCSKFETKYPQESTILFTQLPREPVGFGSVRHRGKISFIGYSFGRHKYRNAAYIYIVCDNKMGGRGKYFFSVLLSLQDNQTKLPLSCPLPGVMLWGRRLHGGCPVALCS